MSPLYTYECPNAFTVEARKVESRPVEERHRGPWCDICHEQMRLVIEAPAVIVKNPAVPRSSK